jgi:catechol 2,3-dioxygenase-like lactoylglutathione lyase family enzyme
MLKRLDHVGIIVDQLDVALERVRDVLGLDEGPRLGRGDVHAVFLNSSNARLELIEIGDPAERQGRLPEGKAASIDHIAFEVEDVNAVFAAITSHSIAVQAPPAEAGGYISFFTARGALAGVTFQFMQRSPGTA